MKRASINVDVLVDDTVTCAVPCERIEQAVVAACQSQGFSKGEIGVRVTTDVEIREINRRHLGHDYATDVISFGYTAKSPVVEGELVVSIETAERTSAKLGGWSTESELLLYVVHGVLHICGHDDHDPAERDVMRRSEQEVMLKLGIDQISQHGADSAETVEMNQDSTPAGASQ